MHGYGLSHSAADNRPKMNNEIETPRYARPRKPQTSFENGDMKEKREGGAFVGFLYKIEIPKFIKGIVKSTPPSRSEVIVKSVIAKSARFRK